MRISDRGARRVCARACTCRSQSLLERKRHVLRQRSNADVDAASTKRRAHTHSKSSESGRAQVRAGLSARVEDTELAALVAAMLAPRPEERPGAGHVADAIGDMLDVRTCWVCACPR